jgi:hypothetical protein
MYGTASVTSASVNTSLGVVQVPKLPYYYSIQEIMIIKSDAGLKHYALFGAAAVSGDSCVLPGAAGKIARGISGRLVNNACRKRCHKEGEAPSTLQPV